MTSEVASELTKLTKRQKIKLADQLLTEAGGHDKPSTIHSSDDPALGAEMRRRLADRSPGAWLSLDSFRARTKASHAALPRP
ncbi:MAG: hypothetical protein IAF94_03345 [Pirellulaceae bacterium]|nr:hypothetical protein [Pirellulaceae bacterium]